MNPVRKLRLAHLIQNDGPGGGPVSVACQVEHLREDFAGCVLHGGKGRLAALCESLGVPHVRLPIQRVWQWPWGLLALIAALRKQRPDILVLHGQWGGALGAVAGRVAGVPAVIYVAHWPAFYTDWALARIHRNFLFERMACRWADRVVTLSPSNRYQYLLRRHADESRLITIPNPVDLRRVPSEADRVRFRQTRGWRDDRVHVVSAGRLADQKRVDWLLRSWSIVCRRVETAHLWIVGDGPERPGLERMAADLAIGPRCTFVGEVPDGIVWLAAGDVVAMTSLYESFGLVLVEAIACGRPVVASAADGIRDVIRDGQEGFLVAPGDVEGMAERLIQFLRDPSLRAAMGEAGKQTAQHYAVEKVMPRYRDLYREVAAEKGVPGGTRKE